MTAATYDANGRWSVAESDGGEVMRHFSRRGARDRWNFPIFRR
jgi:hypothetical protein